MHISKLSKPRNIEGHDIKLFNYNYYVSHELADKLIDRWEGQSERLILTSQLILAGENEWCELSEYFPPLPFSQEIPANGGCSYGDSRKHYEYRRDLRGVKISDLVINFHMSSIHYTYFDFSTFDGCKFYFDGTKDMFFFNNSFNNTCFSKCEFRNGWFFAGTMKDTMFKECNFEEIAFNFNSVDKNEYQRIIFVNCNFSGCDLSRIDLQSCIFIGDCKFDNVKLDNNDLNSFNAIGQDIIKQIKIWDKEHWEIRKHIKSVTFPGKGKPIINRLESNHTQSKSKNNIMIRLIYSGLIEFYEFASDKYDSQKGRSLFSRTHYVLSWLIDEKSSINRRPKMFFKYFLSRWVAGYGDRPETSIIAWIISVSFFAVMLSFSGIKIDNKIVTLMDQSTLLEVISFLMTSLYFSVITATTVGYGDIGPGNWLSMLLAALNAVIGMFLFTTFTVVMVRRLFK